ncbi:MAG TPA: M1 family metallopeptidase [Polyangiaceae bacterium]|nr:M1 family metallopeptidase [Polyangiaceae bacterium]
MSRTSKILLALALTGCAASAPAPVGSSASSPSPAGTVAAQLDAVPPPREDGRLPAGVRPTRYTMDLSIDPSKKTFGGEVRIGVSLERPLRAIVMHGRGLTVKEAFLHTARGKLVGKSDLRMAAGSREDAEELVLVFPSEAPAGDAELELHYEAPFNHGLHGLYNVEESGVSYAFTQFEPNDARRAYPCFDEPGFKVPFELSITVPKGSMAISNTKVARQHDNAAANTVTFNFEKSPPLPTYLVAFGVGPFDVLEGPQQPVPVRLISAKGKAGLGKLAVDTAAAHLELLGKYFNRPYPYTKLDIVAVPNFASGAMENPGFVTFREELLLLDPEHASTQSRRAMAGVIAHELAHQWFGDLVTMQWWDDLWLNEAFASWMSRKIVDQWRPASQSRLESVGERSNVMAHDSLSTARKIRNPVNSTSDALEAFDGITYGKGQAVLTMIEAWIGEEQFREGMRRYIKKHEWGNATASDLYAALSEASGRDVSKVMNSFTDQTGVPVVSATCRAGEGADSSVTVQLHQEEYRTLDRKGPSNKLWHIPVCVVFDGGEKIERECMLLDSAEAKLDLGKRRAKGASDAGCPAYLYPNAGESGYDRIKLDRADLEKLTKTGLGKLSDLERFGLVSNAWAEVWSGDLPAAAYFEVLGSFKKESSRLVWREIIDSLHAADRAVVTDAARPAFARFVRDTLGPLAHRLGWTTKKDEPDDLKLLRVSVLGALGSLGRDEWAMAQAKRVTDAWLDEPFQVDADLAKAALPVAAKQPNESLFERLKAVLKSPRTPEIRVLALSGLAGFDDPKYVERVLDMMIDKTIKAQDLQYIFRPLSSRRATRDITFAWLEKHFDDVVKVIPRFVVGRLVHVTASMCDAGQVRAAEAFFSPRLAKIDGTEKPLRQSVEDGLRCAALADKESSATAKWLGAR